MGMASKYPRLGVARDPELEQALALTRPLLRRADTRSAAAQIRALALRGARSVVEEAGSAAELRRDLQEKYGATPATVDPRHFKLPAGDVNPDDPTPASDALRWVRAKD